MEKWYVDRTIDNNVLSTHYVSFELSSHKEQGDFDGYSIRYNSSKKS